MSWADAHHFVFKRFAFTGYQISTLVHIVCLEKRYHNFCGEALYWVHGMDWNSVDTALFTLSRLACVDADIFVAMIWQELGTQIFYQCRPFTNSDSNFYRRTKSGSTGGSIMQCQNSATIPLLKIIGRITQNFTCTSEESHAYCLHWWLAGAIVFLEYWWNPTYLITPRILTATCIGFLCCWSLLVFWTTNWCHQNLMPLFFPAFFSSAWCSNLWSWSAVAKRSSRALRYTEHGRKSSLNFRFFLLL